MKTASKLPNGPASTRKRARSGPRVVYTQAPMQLAGIVGRAEDRWRVRIGTLEHVVPADPSVDPVLLEEAMRTGARAVLDASGDVPVIVGLLVTTRSLTVDREGVVDAKVRSLRVAAEEEITLKIPRAFFRMQGEQLETYGQQILTRARGVLRLLGVAIKLN
jgi:phosphohistidine swiveling domain-containing protein